MAQPQRGGGEGMNLGARVTMPEHTTVSSQPLQADLLLVTVTSIEADAVLTQVPNYQRRVVNNYTYYDLGVVGGVRVWMVQVGIDGDNAGDALLTLTEGIEQLSPVAVVMVGTAFGMKLLEQNLGDILISTHIFDYEVRQVNDKEKIYAKREQPPASDRLLARLKEGADSWQDGAEIQFGLFLSGSNVIDNQAFVEGIQKLAPEAIGGEMAGAGLYAVAQRYKLNWVIIKAICVWADGKQKQDIGRLQKLAAENAARFTFHVLQQGGLGDLDGLHRPDKPLAEVRSSKMSDASSLHRPGAIVSPGVRSMIASQETFAKLPVILSTKKSRRTALLIGAGAGVVIVGGLGLALPFLHRIGAKKATASHSTSTKQSTLTTPTDPSSISTGNPSLILAGHTASVTSVAWSADGAHVASACFDGTVCIWDALNGGSPLFTFTTPAQKSMWAVAWSPNRQFLISGCADGHAYMWDAINGGSAKLSYNGHSDAVNAVSWAKDSTRVVTGSADKTVQVWEVVNNGQTLATHSGYTAPVTSVAWSPGDIRVVAGSRDKTLRVWTALGNGDVHITYTGHTDSVNGVAWSPNSNLIASGSDDNTVRVWDPSSGNTVFTYTGHSDHVNPVAWSPDSRRIASGSWDHTVHVWDATTGAHLFVYKEHTDNVNSVAWSSDGKRIASASTDKTIRIWDAP